MKKSFYYQLLHCTSTKCMSNSTRWSLCNCFQNRKGCKMGVSASVVVITKEDIEKISATTLKDVLNKVIY
ncbi:hypothetical protein MASR2M54_19420 [Aliarcobacter cryaerophilus]